MAGIGTTIHNYISKALTKLFASGKKSDKDVQALAKRKKERLKRASDLKAKTLDD